MLTTSVCCCDRASRGCVTAARQASEKCCSCCLSSAWFCRSCSSRPLLQLCCKLSGVLLHLCLDLCAALCSSLHLAGQHFDLQDQNS